VFFLGQWSAILRYQIPWTDELVHTALKRKEWCQTLLVVELESSKAGFVSCDE